MNSQRRVDPSPTRGDDITVATSLLRNRERYAGIRANPHGFTVATMPVENAKATAPINV